MGKSKRTLLTYFPSALAGAALSSAHYAAAQNNISEARPSVPAAFKRASKGAAPRSINDKLADLVAPEDFGAVGNGHIDDTAALQSALDTGYDVMLGPKVYVTDKLYLSSGQKLRGRSIWSTQLKAKAKAGSGYLINLKNNGVYAAGLTDLTLNLNAKQQIAELGGVNFDNEGGKDFPFYDPKHSISKIYVVNSSANGVYLSGSARGSSLNEIYVQQCDGTGMLIEATDCFIADVVCGACGVGFHSSGANNRHIGIKAFGSKKAGIIVAGLRDRFVAAEAQDNLGDGFVITDDARNVVLDACIADSNARYGFYFRGGKYIELVGATSLSRAGAKTQRAGFGWGAAESVRVSGVCIDNEVVSTGNIQGKKIKIDLMTD